MHPLMIRDPVSNALSGQVALRYIEQVGPPAGRDVVEHFLEFIKRKASDAIPLRGAEHLR